jgi:hypothetical protein
MEITAEVLIKGDIGLNEHHCSLFFENIPEETFRGEKLFCCGKHSSYCRR